MELKAPRGTCDILPAEAQKWQYIEQIMRQTAASFGFQEIRTPIFEHTELFLRGVGETTDIVTKEMYSFNDKSRRSLTLRPEGTASCVRSLIEHRLYGGVMPVKWYYQGPMFRYDRPQAGASISRSDTSTWASLLTSPTTVATGTIAMVGSVASWAWLCRCASSHSRAAWPSTWW